jgi:glycosyltransferase involved in cell wall biosynthesis
MQKSNAPITIAYVVFQAHKRSDGGVRSIELIIDALVSRRIVRPILITNAKNELSDRWRSKGYKVIDEPFELTGDRHERTEIPSTTITMWEPQIRPVLMDLLRTEQVNIIHCNDPIAMWYAAWTAKKCKTKVITHIRGTCGLKTDYLLQHSRKISDALIVLSDEMKAMVEENLPGRCPVEVIGSMIGPDMWAEPEKTRQRKTGSVAIVGQLQPIKGQLELLRSVKKDPGILRGLTLYFIGDSPMNSMPYQRECKEIGKSLLGKIVFAGYQENMGQWYRAMDAVLIASKHEGLVRSMIESLSCGVPVVSTPVCSAREILSKHSCGFVVARGNHDELLRCASILSECPNLRVAMGNKGIETTRELFSEETISKKHRDFYMKLLQEQT